MAKVIKVDKAGGRTHVIRVEKAGEGSPPAQPEKRGRLPLPLKTHGGKRYLAPDLVRLFPRHKHYVEPYFGGGAPLLCRDPDDESLWWPDTTGVSEVVNDLSGDLTNFWRVMAKPSLFALFERRCTGTPFSEAVYEEACELLAAPRQAGIADPQRAWAYFVACRQSLAGRIKCFTPITKTRTRSGMNNEASAWINAVDGLYKVHERMRRVVVLDRRKAVSVIQSQDDVSTFFYCFAPGSLVRTEDERFIPIEQVEEGQRLAPGRTVKSVQTREHDGLLLSLHVQGMPTPLRVTDEHRVIRIPRQVGGRQELRTSDELWREREVVPAGRVEPGDYLLAPTGGMYRGVDWAWSDVAKKRGVRKAGVTFCPSDALFRLIGYYAAEGHIQRVHGNPCGVILSFGAHEKDTWVADAVRIFSECFGITADVQTGPSSDSVLQVRVWSSTVAEFFQRFVPGTARTKSLAADLMTADFVSQRQLLIGWLRGDGGLEVAAGNRVKLLGTTTSEALAMQMFTVAIRCGLRPSWKLRGGRIYDVYFAKADADSLGWEVPEGRKDCSSRRVVNGHMLSRVRSIDVIAYRGPVWDVDVDGDDLFCAPFVLVHNCDPPYLTDTRSAPKVYEHEMNADDHRHLLSVLGGRKAAGMVWRDQPGGVPEAYRKANPIKGKFLLSGYHSPLYAAAAQSCGWHVKEFKVANNAAGGSEKRIMTEVVWMNYNPDKRR